MIFLIKNQYWKGYIYHLSRDFRNESPSLLFIAGRRYVFLHENDVGELLYEQYVATGSAV